MWKYNWLNGLKEHDYLEKWYLKSLKKNSKKIKDPEKFDVPEKLIMLWLRPKFYEISWTNQKHDFFLLIFLKMFKP